ncbi:hypothetical protein Poli38472_000480 [Pythium oligandrum]|uniref:M96 mating-specific protein family n=1 Tax=Pythium oligandrum TaxID=41045 RepID=A0A8K1CCE7_PYTOL|nr:hypothetical protein Poli38472_000480 [Pythium oligandrum]|eukprot:TMW60438.1 hypothetical protein Poli38472_000480 [Pythium oligandrum]
MDASDALHEVSGLLDAYPEMPEQSEETLSPVLRFFLEDEASGDAGEHSDVWLDELAPQDDEAHMSQIRVTGALTAAALRPMPTGSRQSKPRRRRCNPNKARDEQRQELLGLRKSVAQLEQELELLRVRVDPVTHNSGSSGHSRVSALSRVWEDIAARQRRERRRAEEENIQLKVVLDDQIKFARSLEKLIMKRSAMRSFESCGIGNQEHMYRTPAQRKDPAVYAELLQSVEICYLEIDSLFRRMGISDMEHSHHDSQIRQGPHGKYVETCQNNVLPVPAHAAGAAAWQHFAANMARIPFRRYYERTAESLDVTKDTILESIGIQLHVNDVKVDWRPLQVLRRYVEEERVVIVWSAVVDLIEFNDRSVSGLRFGEKGYMVFTAPKTLDPDGYCVLKMCHVITPEFSTVSPQSPEDAELVQKITDFVLSEGIQRAAGTHQVIENMLLHQAMRQS